METGDCLREHRISRRSFCEMLAAVSAAGFAPELLAEIVNDGGRLQPSVARAKRPVAIDDMATYLKRKWRSDLSNPETGLAGDALA